MITTDTIDGNVGSFGQVRANVIFVEDLCGFSQKLVLVDSMD